MDVNEELKFFVKIQKKNWGVGGGGVGSVGVGLVGGQVVGGGGRVGGGSGWM